MSAGWRFVVIDTHGAALLLTKAPLEVRMRAVAYLQALRTALDLEGKSFQIALEGTIKDLKDLMHEEV